MLDSVINRLSLSILALLLLSGCSARIESDATDGKIDDYKHDESLQRSIRLSWTCQSTSLVSSLFSPSGSSSCGGDDGWGEVLAPIEPDGTFRIPPVESKVTKFFSRPSLYSRWEIVTVDEDGVEDRDLITGGRIFNRLHFKGELDRYSSLRHIAIEDTCVDASIVAIEGSERFPYDDILQRYPDSHNMSRRYFFSVTLKRDGVVVMSPNFGMPYENGRFCSRNFGLFLPADSAAADETLSYYGRVEVSAGVVYSTSPPNPENGQRTRDYRLAKGLIVRRGESPVGAVNRIPPEMLAPISIELDITHASKSQ